MYVLYYTYQVLYAQYFKYYGIVLYCALLDKSFTSKVCDNLGKIYIC